VVVVNVVGVVVTSVVVVGVVVVVSVVGVVVTCVVVVGVVVVVSVVGVVVTRVVVVGVVVVVCVVGVVVTCVVVVGVVVVVCVVVMCVVVVGVVAVEVNEVLANVNRAGCAASEKLSVIRVSVSDIVEILMTKVLAGRWWVSSVAGTLVDSQALSARH